jgi:hypothetical protein
VLWRRPLLDYDQMCRVIVFREHIDLDAAIESPRIGQRIVQDWKRLIEARRLQPELDENDVTHKPSSGWSKGTDT